MQLTTTYVYYIPCGLVLLTPVTSFPSPKSLKAITLTLYSELIASPRMAALVELRIRCTSTPLLYTLYLTGSPPVLEGAVQCKFSWSHLLGGGVITSPVGAPGTVGTCIYSQ